MAPSGSGSPPSTCLFLPELPPDVSDSILERHFRGFTGFSTCRTRHDRNGKLVGFIEFDQVDDAVRCRDSMQGTSPFPGISWHIHFSNSAPKGGAGSSAPKRPRDESAPPVARHDAVRPSYGSAPSMMPPPPRDDGRYAPSPGGQISPHVQPQGYHALPPTSGYPPPPRGQYAVSPHAPPSDPMTALQPAPLNYAAITLPHDATSTLYIEGLPPDASEREVSHVFRRYDGHGFQGLRMRAIESNRAPGTNLLLCFAEFDNAHQATVALHGLQGYRFDPKGAPEQSGIRISYAKAKAARPSARSLPPPQYESGFPREPAQGDRRSEEPYDDDRRDYDRRDFDRRDYDGERGRSGYRRDTREHHDGFRDDYEDSEVGDNDVLQRADQVSMHGVTDT